MSGFQPLFPGTAPSRPGADGPDGGFTPMFGGQARSRSGPDGFVPLGASAPATEPSTPRSDGPDAPGLDERLTEAREAGAQEARASMQAELDALQARLDTLGPALDAVATLRADAIRQAAADVGTLVEALAGRLLQDSLAVHPEALHRILTQAVQTLPDEDPLRVFVAPDDVDRAADVLGDRTAVEVIADPQVRGGCRIEARHTAVDATVDTALEGLQAAVRTWVEAQS